MKIGNVTLELVLGDITEQSVDAIVNAANAALAGGGGVDGAIHRKGGPAVMEETRAKYPEGCAVGSVVATGAGKLPARYVFHAVGPVWRGGRSGEAESLRSAYRACLALAADNRCGSIAFPSISTGAYRYPLASAAAIALGTTINFLKETPDTPLTLVRFCLFSGRDLQVYENCLEELTRESRVYTGQVKPGRISINILVDSSGSMAPIAEDMSGSLNTLMAQNRDADALVTCSTFSNEYEPRFADKPISEVPQFHIEPRDRTALLESACKMIDEVDARFAAAPELPEKIWFVIVTDGHENHSSPEYTRARLKAKIEEHTEKHGWLFQYYGADADAFDEADSIGINRDHTVMWERSRAGVERNIERLERHFNMVRSAKSEDVRDISFDDEDRME
jgi:O-acetyl-ADP-ribose deacetylase (regulator of RNase III)